jgi:hypothetical protein
MHSMAARGDSITKLLFGASRPAADSLSCVTARHENEINSWKPETYSIGTSAFVGHVIQGT